MVKVWLYTKNGIEQVDYETAVARVIEVIKKQNLEGL